MGFNVLGLRPCSNEESLFWKNMESHSIFFRFLATVENDSTRRISSNFLLQQNITQSLAGRVAYLQLLPFALQELYNRDSPELSRQDTVLLTGGYPPIHDHNIPPQDWLPNYLRTYIERDVRQIKNVTDLIVFERFIRLLAGRSGQELNITPLAVEVGVDIKTIQSWIGILESSFIIFLLRPPRRSVFAVLDKGPFVRGMAYELQKVAQ